MTKKQRQAYNKTYRKTHAEAIRVYRKTYNKSHIAEICIYHAKHWTPEYQSWRAMLQRARNHNGKHPSYKNVRACHRWRGKNGFRNFSLDMGPRVKGTTLGRFLDSGNYQPGNCSWQTWEQQGKERRRKQMPQREGENII